MEQLLVASESNPMDTIGLNLKKDIPYLPAAVQRPQLLAKLHSALRHKLVLISAPPGYGKTTLASQFANQAPYPVVWHTIEERERDFPNLYHHCLSALEPLLEGIHNSLLSPDSVPASELAMLVGDYIRQAHPNDFIYVLDDVHHLDGMTRCESWLRILATRLPRSCHVILISRTLPNLPYAEMVARSKISAIGPDDLRLTDDEIYSLSEEVLGDLPLASIIQTLSALNGWPAGVFLALQISSPSLTDSVFGGSQGPEALFEALARPMLLAQPPDLRDFLLGSSTLPRLTPELCEKVLRLPNSAEWLTVVQTRNLFISRASGGMEYHGLFRDVLQRELRNTSVDRYTDLHLKSAQWFEEIDDIEQAFEHYIAADRADQAQRLTEKTAIAYFGQGKFETMLHWSERLREAGMLSPNLSFECSMIHTDRYEYQAAEIELKNARKGFNSAGNVTGATKVDLQRAMIYFLQAKYHKALKISYRIASLPESSLRGRALRIIGMSLFHLGDAAAAIEYLEEAVKLYRKQGLVSSLSHLLQDLQLVHMRLGNLDKMGSCLQEVVALRRKLHGKGALALALVSLGYYYHKRSNYQEALSVFDEALQLVAGSTDRRAEGYLLASLGDLNRDLGLYASAQAAYDNALQVVDSKSDPNLYCAILISRSTLRRWQGRADEAVLLAEEASKIAAEHQIAFEATMSEITLWLARAASDDPGQALKHLNAAVEDLDKQGAHFEMLEVLGGCAHVAALCEDKEATDSYLTLALRLTQAAGTGQSLAAEIIRKPALETLVARMPRSAPLMADLNKLREAQIKFGREANTPSHISQIETYSLHVLTLGQEKIERDSKALSISDWQAAAPRELFYYLLFNGPKGRTDIELVFWPESGPDQVRGLFHTALHRARQALGSNVIIYKDDKYCINPDLNIECDAHQLESWTTQARLLPPHDARADDLWQKAVAVYGGEFLRSLDAQWVVAWREQYQGMHLDALMGLGHCARTRKDLKTATEWFSAAIILDPYSEDAYRHLMRCYTELGEMSKVQACFSELKAIFRDELGIDPSEDTVTLVRSVLGNF